MTSKFRLHRISIIILIMVIVFSIEFTPAVLAAAGDGTTPGSISAIPTFECIGVTVNYSGDNNQNNSAVLEYRPSGGTWKTAPEMYVDRAERQYRGNIFWITANTQYEIRVTLIDANGGGGSVSTTTATRNDNPPIGTNYIYVATNGNDTTGNGSIGSPYRTIQKASDVSSPGSTILIRGGTYSEEVELSVSGTSTGWITFMPYNNENVIITGNGTIGILFYGLQKNYIRFKGLNFRDSLYPAIYLSVSHDSIIENCTFHNNHTEYGIAHGDGYTNLYGAVSFKGKSLEVPTPERDNIVCYNHLVQNCSFDWTTGGEGLSSGVGLVKAQYGIVIRNNTISSAGYQLWDGVSTYPEDVDSAEDYLESCDFYGNKIYRAADDGLQIEGGDKNTRIWNNYIEDCDIGIATCPVLEGPAYVFRNVVWNASGRLDSKATKTGKQTTGYGRLYYYHNTYYMVDANNGITQTNDDIGNIVSRNNIVYCGRYVIELKNSINVPCDFDYDFLWSTDVPDNNYFVKYGADGANTLAILQSKTGQEMHGVSTADAGFANAASGNFQLRADSPCVNAGVALQGFNDANSPWPYSGGGPDIGAYEYTGVPAEDNTPPYTSGHNPQKYSTTAAPNTNIVVHIRDTGTGVDQSSIVMRVEGSTVSPTITGNKYDYTLSYNPPVDFDYEQVVDVMINARDLKATPNVMNQESYNFTIRSEGENQPPVGVSDYYSNEPDTTLSVPAPGILGNDNDVDGDSLTVIPISGVSHGSLTLNPNGSFNYTPDPGYTGPDSFSYRANDGEVNSNSVVVTINITSAGGGGGSSDSGNDDDDNVEITSVFNFVTSSGKFNIEVIAQSSDNSVKINIPKETVGTNSMGVRLINIVIEKMIGSVPPPPDDAVIVGSVYDIAPDGAKFEPTVNLIMSYSDNQVPYGVAEKNLIIGTFDRITGEWQAIPSSTNQADNTVSANLEHFSTYALLAYTHPASFEIADISTYPDIVTCGSNVDIQATVVNTGDLTGDYEVCLMLDDEVYATELITLDGGDIGTVIFSTVPDIAGIHRISIGVVEKTFTAETYEAPAEFITSNITITPSVIYLGERVEISTLLSNIGDLPGVYEAILKMDNEFVDSKYVDIAGGDSEIIIFTITPETEGEHAISIGEKVVFFTVKSTENVDVEIITMPKPEISRFDITPTYNPGTSKIESTRIDYQIKNSENLDAGAMLVLKVFRDGELWEEIPLITLNQVEADQDSGYLSYVPSEGWSMGTYIFEAELQGPNGVVHSIQFEKFTLIEESLTKGISWGSLGIIIGGTLIVLLTVLAIVIYRRREMLRGYVE